MGFMWNSLQDIFYIQFIRIQVHTYITQKCIQQQLPLLFGCQSITLRTINYLKASECIIKHMLIFLYIKCVFFYITSRRRMLKTAYVAQLQVKPVQLTRFVYKFICCCYTNTYECFHSNVCSIILYFFNLIYSHSQYRLKIGLQLI